MFRHLPNTLTCANLLCGCIGIVMAFNGSMLLSCWLIGAALIFDFLDGFFARLLSVTSPIGKDLDSLADMVTFGVLPSIIIFQLLNQSVETLMETWKSFPAFLITICSALRLAKFNHDPRQTDAFIGLPTPANAVFIASLPLIIEANPESEVFIINTTRLWIFTLLSSFLLISELKLFALKFKNFAWVGNEVRYGFLGISVLLMAFLGVLAVPLIIVCYLLLSLGLRLTPKRS